MSVQDSDSSATIDPTKFSISSSDVTESTVKLNWELPTEDDLVSAGLKYSVYYTKGTDFNSVDDMNLYQKHPYHLNTVKPFMGKAKELSVSVDYEF